MIPGKILLTGPFPLFPSYLDSRGQTCTGPLSCPLFLPTRVIFAIQSPPTLYVQYPAGIRLFTSHKAALFEMPFRVSYIATSEYLSWLGR